MAQKDTLARMVNIRLQVLGLKRADICTPATGINISRLGMWMSGETMNVTSLRNLAAALKIDPAVLLYEGEGFPPELLILPDQTFEPSSLADASTRAAMLADKLRVAAE